MKVLIAGAGIAGLTLALCLRRAGHEPLVVEAAPRLRDQGYMIDFFGSGYDAAERLGLLDDLAGIHDQIARLVFLGPDGRERFAIGYARLRRRLFDDRHFNFMRGELERVLHAALPADVPARFGTRVQAVRPHGGRIQVELSDGASETMDLVVGADGVHSPLRRLVFGPDERFERYLGYRTAAFIIDQPLPEMPDDAFCILTEPHRQVGVHPFRGGRLATFFVHAADRRLAEVSTASARQELHAVYGDMGWLVPELLRRCDRAHGIYFDEVSQIEMPGWHRGRVALVGDACQCVSLLAGQGASMAMAGAYVLAEELSAAADDIGLALTRYEARLRPAIESKQRAGRGIARWFVPDSGLRLMIRDMALRAASWPLAASILKRRIAAQSIFRGSLRPSPCGRI